MRFRSNVHSGKRTVLDRSERNITMPLISIPKLKRFISLFIHYYAEMCNELS